MKTLDLSNVVANVRRLGAIKETLEHLGEAYTEAMSRMMIGLNALDTDVTTLTGVVNSLSHPNYDISAGSAYYNGELFEVLSFTGVAGGAQVPVLSINTSYRSGDPVLYSDSSTQYTHANRRLVWAFGASGSGIKDYSQLVRFVNRVDTFLGVTTLSAAAEANAKAYTDATGANYVLKAGATMSGPLGLPATGATAPTHATRYADLTAYALNKSGDTMSGPFSMNGNRLSGLPTGVTGPTAAASYFQISSLGVPAGVIAMWAGTTAPTGWALCDGSPGTPDLRTKFIVGYKAGDPSYGAIGNSGGEETHLLTSAESGVPAIDLLQYHQLHGGAGAASGWTGGNIDGIDPVVYSILGAAAANAHENRPPYYTLAYIIKT
jgi:microcystin-dependent protein